ncbi:hypothetical protein N9E52_01800 [Alphaproteobacteria bacterium]|nr:hypothetical protein [Alphaproteobacteria bacterium]
MENDLLSHESPEEVFVEGIKGLYCYNGIVKFNLISRPVHDPSKIDGAKVVKTITTTVQNFENMINFLQSELNQIKSSISETSLVTNNQITETNHTEKPNKGKKL